MRAQRLTPARGFTLLELALVLAIMAVIAGGLLLGLHQQVDALYQQRTEQRLYDIRQALLGFAAAHGRLPCPAAPASSGDESPSGGGNCSHPYTGLLPGKTLGLGPTDAQGYVLDAWGQAIHYAVSPYNANSFTTSANQIKSALAASDPNLLYLCTSATGLANSDCGTASELTHHAVAIIYSTGKNGSYGGSSADENANPNPASSNNDRVFVSREPGHALSSTEFDDIIIWISPYLLYQQLIAAGQVSS